MRDLLLQLGLTDLEIRVYQMLLDHGPSLAGYVTTRTGIHRRNVYDCLERLIQKGLVGYITSNNRKLYSIADPRHIIERIEAQKRGWEEHMSELLAKYQHTSEKGETLFYRGITGVRQVFEDQIKVGKEVLILATPADIVEKHKHFFARHDLMRRERGVRTRMLVNEDPPKEPTLCKFKKIPGLNSTLTSRYVYGDTTAIITWKEEPFAIVIREKDVTQAFREEFEILWKMI